MSSSTDDDSPTKNSVNLVASLDFIGMTAFIRGHSIVDVLNLISIPSSNKSSLPIITS